MTGLRVSIAEARTALGQSRRNRIARYDQAGLRPIIVDLANATASRASAREMLAPILALDVAKAKEIVQTLQIYLDEQSSLARTAERLLLHRNTVAYRVRRAKSLLDNELDDSDQRLALQLACRTYLLEQSAAAPGDENRREHGDTAPLTLIDTAAVHPISRLRCARCGRRRLQFAAGCLRRNRRSRPPAQFELYNSQISQTTHSSCLAHHSARPSWPTRSLATGTKASRLARLVREHTGRTPAALMPSEIGGINGLLPVVWALGWAAPRRC